jgi:hypothetical protein
MRKRLLALTAAAAVFGASAAHASAANCGATDVPQLWPAWPAGDITSNTTWSGTVVLQSPVFVKNGATLTITPGTIVRGQPRQQLFVAGQTAGSPGALIVTQNGRLVADANAANPIIMTTAATDNDADGIADDADGNPGFDDLWNAGDVFLDDTCGSAPLAPLDKAGNANAQLWGGLVVLGNAPTNIANVSTGIGLAYGQTTIEGLPAPGFPVADATYGGNLPHDNSGILRFVSVRHAGDEIGNSNELNGVTLGGVGDGTLISNVEVYVNFDDGFEWFGGTVNGDHLAVFFAGDDAFDVDQGYSGVNQYLYAHMPFFNENDTQLFGTASGDKVGEFDGDDSDVNTIDRVSVRINQANTVVDSTPWPLSAPAFYNLTAIGSTPDGARDFTPVSSASTNRGIQFRHCFAGDVFNSIVVDTGAETGIEVDLALAANCPVGHSVLDHVNTGFVNLVCSTLDDGAALAANELAVVAAGDTLSELLRGAAPSTTDNNSVNPATFDLVNDDITFDPTGDASGKLVASLKVAATNPRTVQGIGRPNAGCVAPRGTGVEPGATYRGAFSFSNPLWTNGWTSLSQAGLLAN